MIVMKSSGKKSWWVVHITVIILLLFCFSSAALSGGRLVRAPLNPEYMKYTEGSSSWGIETSGSETGTVIRPPSFGYRPSPVDLSHSIMKARAEGQLTEQVTFPDAYDLRDHNKVTSVKDQDIYGTCWSFAVMGSIESFLKPSENRDLSEYHLAWYAYSGVDSFTGRDLPAGWHEVLDQGGNDLMATALLARWTGPVYEGDCEYDIAGGSPSLGANESTRKHLQNVDFLFSPSQVRGALMEDGAVYLFMLFDWGSYNDQTFSYFYNESNKVAAGYHCVNIAGWDDNYPKNNFTIDSVPGSTPSSNGAWLVKNTWGSEWGDSGYFWISYEDAELRCFSMFSAEPEANYLRNYQYDPLGWLNSLGYNDDFDGSDFFANIFTSEAKEIIGAVSFYSTTDDATYSIAIFTDAGPLPDKGVLYHGGEGLIAHTGYHTVELAHPVPLEEGQKFSVLVNQRTPGYGYPIPAEYNLEGYSENATASLGQSFVSDEGVDWEDIAEISPGYNVCLKAFTLEWPEGLEAMSIISPSLNEEISGTTANLEWTSAGDDVTYDVYFGKTTMALKAEDINDTEYAVPGLSRGDTYYWYVVAENGSGDELEGPVGIFSVGIASSGEGGGGGTGGGCSVSFFTWSWSLLLIPLLLISRR